MAFFVCRKGLSSKHTSCLNNFAMQNRNKHCVCFSSQKLPYSGASVFVYGVLRNPTRHNKKPKADKSTLDFLVRRKGLEPPTYWFVASHSIQLSYRRVCNRLSLLLKYYNILQSKMQVFFDYYIMKM